MTGPSWPARGAGARGWSKPSSPWLTASPVSGTVPAYSSTPVEVTFDATGMQPDTYTTQIRVQSNDPVTPSVSVPVTMTVTVPITYGKLEGTVYSLGGDVEGEDERLIGSMQTVTWPDGRKVYSVPVALSIMVFFALCVQCAATLITIKQENGKVIVGEKPFDYFGNIKENYEARNKDYTGVYEGK